MGGIVTKIGIKIVIKIANLLHKEIFANFTFEYVPFLIFVGDKKLIKLLTLELQLVLRVLLDGLVIRDGVVLRGQKCFERHHRRLDHVRVAAAGANAIVHARATAAHGSATRRPVIAVVHPI